MRGSRGRSRLTTVTPVLSAIALTLLAASSASAAGALDPSFGNGGTVLTAVGSGYDTGALSATTQADGRIVVVGYSRDSFLVSRFNADGSADTTFGGGAGYSTTDLGGASAATDVALQSDGKIVVSGVANWHNNGGREGLAVARYLVDGSPDPSFGSGGVATTPGFGVKAQRNSPDLLTHFPHPFGVGARSEAP